MDVRAYNRRAWDRRVEGQNKWTVPVGPEVIAGARAGRWEIQLTSTKPVPRDWFPALQGLEVLCLASGGGQQAPVLAAAGARVTVVDNSPAQLAQDQRVAEREALQLTIVEGDMRDLSMFDDDSFDLIVHPCSNMFVPEVGPVWKEAFRVLCGGGALLSGFYNPAYFIFNPLAEEQGRLEVCHRLPYSDMTSLSDDERKHYTDRGEPLVFGHTLEDLVGGQLASGFVLTGFYEDYCPEAALSRFMPVLLATRTVKP